MSEPQGNDDGSVVRELEALRREVERLRVLASGDAQHVLAAILDHCPHGITLCDAEGRLTLRNRAAERIWAGSTTAEGVADWGEYRAFHPDGRPYEPDDWSMVRCLRSRTIVPAEEVAIQRFDGTHGVLVASCAPILGPDGELRGAIGVYADITESHRLASAERAARERVTKLQEITAALSTARLPDDVAAVVVHRMGAALGAQQAVLALASPDARELLLFAQAGLLPPLAESFARFSADSDLPISKAFRTGKPVWISSREDFHARHPSHPDVSPMRSQAMACAPLIVDGVRLGAIGFAFSEVRVFRAAERSLVEDFALQAALALERARLHEGEQRARRRLELLAGASRRFAESGLEPESVLDRIVVELGRVLESATGITLVNPDGTSMRAAAHFHPDPMACELLGLLNAAQTLRVGEGILGTVAATGESMLVPSISLEAMREQSAPDYRAFVERFPMYAIVCAPLRARGRIIGTLAAMRTRPGETYTPDDRLLLEELADRAAIAIESARLYQELRAHR